MFRRLNLNSISFGNRKSYRLKEKLASTLAAAALACGCAASLSACGNKNHAAKSPAPSASETTTDDNKDVFDIEVGDAGLNFKTIYSDALKMNLSVPEIAENTYSDPVRDDNPEKAATEIYMWEKDGVYYQYQLTRGFDDPCPPDILSEYDDYVEEYNDYVNGENRWEDVGAEMVGDTVIIYLSDWSAKAVTKVGGGCTVVAGIGASEKLVDNKLTGKMIEGSYYKNGIDEAKKQQIRPVIKAVMEKTKESFKTVK